MFVIVRTEEKAYEELGKLNEAVKRNRDRFPADFMFQLAVKNLTL